MRCGRMLLMPGRIVHTRSKSAESSRGRPTSKAGTCTRVKHCLLCANDNVSSPRDRTQKGFSLMRWRRPGDCLGRGRVASSMEKSVREGQAGQAAPALTPQAAKLVSTI